MDKIHLGAYCVARKDNSVLVIKKARGPYAGFFDLPGGKIEFGESIEECLERELKEETGLELFDFSFLTIEECIFNYKKDNEEKNFHHIGLYHLVSTKEGHLNTDGDGQDSEGALFMDINKINETNCSAIAYQVINKLIIKKS